MTDYPVTDLKAFIEGFADEAARLRTANPHMAEFHRGQEQAAHTILAAVSYCDLKGGSLRAVFLMKTMERAGATDGGDHE